MRLSTLTVAFSVALCALSPAAQAVTAGDVVQGMTIQERNAFLTGIIVTTAYNYRKAGDNVRAQCVEQWYLSGRPAIDEIFGAFESYRDRAAVAIMEVLMRRHCG